VIANIERSNEIKKVFLLQNIILHLSNHLHQTTNSMKSIAQHSRELEMDQDYQEHLWGKIEDVLGDTVTLGRYGTYQTRHAVKESDINTVFDYYYLRQVSIDNVHRNVCEEILDIKYHHKLYKVEEWLFYMCKVMGHEWFTFIEEDYIRLKNALDSSDALCVWQRLKTYCPDMDMDGLISLQEILDSKPDYTEI